MINNKKMLLWGSAAVLLLASAIVFLFWNLLNGGDKGSFDINKAGISVYHGVPSDAVAVVDFKHFSEYASITEDTSSFLYGLQDAGAGLVQLQERLEGFESVKNAPLVLSLHYSSKNSVSFLQIMELGSDQSHDEAEQLLQRMQSAKKRYNGVTVYTVCNDVVAAVHNNLLIASSSSYVLESSIRHLENNTSILDKPEFEQLLRKNGLSTCLYVNHNQIGKLFSGIVERGFLGYSDFVMKFASWSCLKLTALPGKLIMQGVHENFSDESRFSNVYENQGAKKSLMGRILPASTIFAISMPASSMHEYLKSHNLYLEMQKKAGSFAFLQKQAQGEKKTSPREWVDSLGIEEITSAYCKFGEKCEWVTVIRQKQQFALNHMISSVVEKEVSDVLPYEHQGYISSVFGELFSHCNEEYSCKTGAWTVIGPKTVVEDFANGSATFFTLEDYIAQTPAKGDIDAEASLKMVANLKEAGDSIMQVFKPYYRSAFERQMQKNNFEFMTADIFYTEGVPHFKATFYGSVMERLPQPPAREEGEEMTFAIDSTIAVPQGPFEVKDVAKKSAAYLEQLPNMKLRYLDAAKKGVWAIPFETPICGYVEQVDLYANGRLQMLFASEDKLYLLDRTGKYVKGYPARLPKKVVLGPRLLKNVNGVRYSILVLNDDNTISWRDVSGKAINEFTDIIAPEFVKELPEFLKLGGNRYWVLRAPSQLLLYTIDGKRVELADKKKKIDRSSEIELLQDGTLKIKCTDGKEYAWNLATGKTKKL